LAAGWISAPDLANFLDDLVELRVDAAIDRILWRRLSWLG
jgi:hypothetical protein